MATLCIISYSMKFQSYKRLKATEDLNFTEWTEMNLELIIA